MFLLYSGGKDASVLADLISKVKYTYGLNVELCMLTVKFPRMVYDPSDETEKKIIEKCISYWQDRGFNHLWLDTKDCDDSIFDRYQNTPCVACEIVKSKVLYKFMSSCTDTAFLISHTLDDVFGYLIESLFILIKYGTWENLLENDEEIFGRVGQLQKRVYRIFSHREFKKKNVFIYKPILDMSEQEIISRLTTEEFPLIEESCPKKMGKQFVIFKRFIHQALDWFRKRYNSSNVTVENYDDLIDFFRSKHLLIPKSFLENMNLRSGI
ncbi:hypothetical protein [Desulfurobacterium sp.]